jgi:AcrR family transcriptional regulator
MSSRHNPGQTAMSDAAPNHHQRSLRDQQADLTRELIMRAFRDLLKNDHPEAITYPQVAEAAGVSLRTVYRYFPTRVDLLQSAAAWLAEFTDGVRWDDPRTVYDLTGAVPEMGRVFDEHANVFRALAGDELQESRRAAVAAAVAEVSGNLPPEEVRRAEAILGHIRAGRAWVTLHDHYGLDGDEIVSTLDWAASTLLADVRRRNEVAGQDAPT